MRLDFHDLVWTTMPQTTPVVKIVTEMRPVTPQQMKTKSTARGEAYYFASDVQNGRKRLTKEVRHHTVDCRNAKDLPREQDERADQ